MSGQSARLLSGVSFALEILSLLVETFGVRYVFSFPMHIGISDSLSWLRL